MKTKTKTLALVEVAVLLCSMLLVATLPAIATTASEDEFTLDIYGNANEDDTIDMRDTTYIKLIIFGKKPKTDLADANYDGKVSMLDVGQTKLIILGKEKKLTYIDNFGEAETVNKPIKRMINLEWYGPLLMRTIGARDIVIAIGDESHYHGEPTFYPELSKLPGVLDDFEAMLNIRPDAIMPNVGYGWSLEKKKEYKYKLPGIPLIGLDIRTPSTIYKNLKTLGYIIDKKDEAEEFFDWYNGYLELYKARTEGLSEDEKPRAVILHGSSAKLYTCPASGSRYGWTIPTAGGRNIVDEIAGPDSPLYTKGGIEVDPEWVLEQNPEVIIVRCPISWGTYTLGVPQGYETDDLSGMAGVRDDFLNRPEVAKVDAVENKRVYVLVGKFLSHYGNNIVGPAYMGKLFHPDLFEDIDPQAIHQEYIDKFCYIDFDVRKHGVFVYPPYEEWSV